MPTRRSNPPARAPRRQASHAPNDTRWYMSVGLSERMKAGGDAAIKALLASDGGGINVEDRERMSPLAWAASGGMEDTVQRLLAAGADVNRVDRERRTPLMQVLGSKAFQPTIARWLIEAGTDLSVQDHLSGSTALHMIVGYPDSQGFADLARLALEKGADPNVPNAVGNTPLHETFERWAPPPWSRPFPSSASSVTEPTAERPRGVITITRALLEAGADVNARNQSGDTPLVCAVRGNHWEAADLLVEAGASLDLALERWSFAERMRMPPSEREALGDNTISLQEYVHVLQKDPERWARWEKRAMTGWAHSDEVPASTVGPRARL